MPLAATTWDDLSVITVAGARPIDVALALSFARLKDITENRTVIEALIDAVAVSLEKHGLYCINTVVRQYYCSGGNKMDILPLYASPIFSIVNVSKIAADGTTTVIEAAKYTCDLRRPFVELLDDIELQYETDRNISVEYKAGFGTAISKVPKDLQLGIMTQVAFNERNRDGTAIECQQLEEARMKYQSRFYV